MKLVVLVGFIVLMNGVSYSQDTLSDIKSDTLKLSLKSSYPGKTFPEIFEAAFYDSTIAVTEGFEYTFSNSKIGELKLESGKLIAGDPVTMFAAQPFKYTFPLGSFPVEIAYADDKNGKVVAYSRVSFSNEEVVKWKFALKPNQKDLNLIDTAFYCFGVDAGTAIFIDQKTNQLFNKKGSSGYTEVFIDKQEAKGYEPFMHEFEGHNFAVFSSGYGDGCYGVYIGLDKNNKICKVLIDFAIVNWWD